MLKQKPRKRRAKKKATVGKIIQQFSDIDAAIMPVMIDFGGMSCYQCDALCQTRKEPNTFLAKIFRAWYGCVNAKMNRLAQDFSRIHDIQLQFILRFFLIWRKQTKDLIIASRRIAFHRWLKRTEERRRDKDRQRLTAIAMVRWWRYRALQSKLILKRRQIMINRAFFIWKTHEVLEHRTVLRLYLARANRRAKAKCLKKWITKRTNILLQRQEVACRNILNQAKIENFFGIWAESYIEKAVAGNIKPVKQWQIWKREYNLSQKSHLVQAIRNRLLITRALRKWKRKHDRKRARKLKVIVYRWAVIVVRKMLFHQTQDAIASLTQSFYWRIMVSRVEEHNTGRKLNVLRQWKTKAHMLSCARKTCDIDTHCRQQNHFQAWRKRFTRSKGKRLSSRVGQEVERARIANAFRKWTAAALARLEHNLEKANEFRNCHITRQYFSQWRVNCELKNVRAEHYHNTNLLKKSIRGLLFRIEARETRELQKAERIRKRFLLRWAFSRMFSRMIVMEGEMDEFSLAELLNKKGMPLTKIRYI